MTELEFTPRPTAQRPLLGMTILVVEDSRFTSEALRLMCLRSGARIRRADCLASAERHLNVYRPSVAIVDIGLPDGSGLDLIRELTHTAPRVPIVLGISGAEREAAAAEAKAAGADGFLAKPLEGLTAFQTTILSHLPKDLRPQGARPVDMQRVAPDPMALREDLSRAMDLLALDAPPVGYLKRFLLGIARSSNDAALETQALGMSASFGASDQHGLRALISKRIQDLPLAI